MRILFLSNVYPTARLPKKGTFNGAMLSALAERHHVRVVAPLSWIDRLRTKPQPDAIGCDIPEATDPVWYYPPKLLRHRYGDYLWRSIRGHLRKTVAEFRPDLVLSYWMHPDGEAALNIAREANIPLVAMTGGSDVLLLGRHGKRRAAIQHVIRRADRIVTVSRNLAECLTSDGAPASMIETVYRGIDNTTFTPGDRSAARERLGLPAAEKRPLLVACGRLVEVKRHTDLIDAVGILNGQGIRPRCVIAGEGELRTKLQEQIELHQLDNVIDLPGNCDQTTLADWYRAADAVVLPSRSEGVPNVLLEAIACGSRFVASNVGGIPEIADPAHDRLCAPQQPSDLAAKIRELLSSDPPTTPRRFTPRSRTESSLGLEKILQTVIDSRRGISFDRAHRTTDELPTENTTTETNEEVFAS